MVRNTPLIRVFTAVPILVAGLAVCSCQSAKTTQDLAFPTWEQLSDQLIEALPEVLEEGKGPHDYVFDVPDVVRIRDNGSIDTWLEMCAQQELTMVRVAGFMCVQQRAPERQFEAALTFLSNKPAGESMYFCYPALEFLQDVSATPGNVAAFGKFVNRRHPNHKQFLTAVSFVGGGIKLVDDPPGFLAKWAVSEDIGNADPTVQVMAMDEVFTNAKNEGTAVPESILDHLKSFAESDGIRRAAFVRYAPESVDRTTLTASIIGVLKDDNLNEFEYTYALLDRVDAISELIDVDVLELTPEQLKRWEKLLERHDSDN